jgi:Holliday junction resolvase RusA-like endonuclease
VPAARPRVGKFGTYYPKTYKTWMAAAEADLKKGKHPRIEEPCLAVIEQVLEKPKTTKRLIPRGDADNHAKGPLDVLQKKDIAALAEDDLVVGLTVVKRFAEEGEEPHTRIDFCLI